MIPLLVAAALSFTEVHAIQAYNTASEIVRECTPRDPGTIRGELAANFILDRASGTGADVRRDVFKAMSAGIEQRFVNLYAEYCSNPTGEWTVVLSHYDTKPGVACPGANDGASTSGLLVALCSALNEWRTPRGNVMLVWTDGEECYSAYGTNDGLHGSKRAVEYLTAKNRKVRAAICLDMLGDRDLHITLPRNGSPTLKKIAHYAAGQIGEKDLVSDMREHVRDDHVPFLDAGIPAVDLIDFSYGPGNSWWHTPSDTLDKISKASLRKSGMLVCAMLEVLL